MAVWKARAVDMLAVAVHVFVPGSYNSAVASRPVLLSPPTINT